MKTSVAIAGASGRLGQVLCRVVENHPDFELIEKIGRKSAEDDGAKAEIFIDATNPTVSQGLVTKAIERGQKVIVATSGWNTERLTVLERLVDSTPGAAVLVVPNFSIGSVLGTKLAEMAAPFFANVEIVETHHEQKIDSPSGTAIRTAELVAAARDNAARDDAARSNNEAPFADQEARGQQIDGVSVHSLRMAGVLAKQEVRFGGLGETLTITHDTLSGDSYMAGISAALESIRTLKGITVGLADILGIK